MNDFNGFYEFGPYRLDAVERRLMRDGRAIPLKPKVFETLVLLVENPNHLLTKEQLLDSLWPGMAVEEANIAKNVWAIRQALGEEVEGQSFIETVPRVGYRFVANVRRVARPEETPAPQTPGAAESVPANIDAPRSIQNRMKLWIIAAAAILLTTAAVVILGRSRKVSASRSTQAVSRRRAAAVLRFTNESRRNEDEWLSTALSEMVSAELAAGGRLRTIEGEDVSRMKSDLALSQTESLSGESLSKIRSWSGADFVVVGSYLVLGPPANGRMRLDLRLQDTRTGETLATITQTGNEPQLFDLVSAAGLGLRNKLGISALSAAEAATVRTVLPANPEAVRFYSEGLDKLRSFESAAARDLLDRAVAAEPDFPLAHAALAQASGDLGYDNQASEEARKAFETAGGLPREQSLAIEARLTETLKQWDRAVRIYESLWSFFPDNPEYGLRLAQTQVAAGKAREAMKTIQTLRELPSPQRDDPRIDLAEAKAAGAISDFARQKSAAARAAEKAERLGARIILAEARLEEGGAIESLGDYASAKPMFIQAKSTYEQAGDRHGEAQALRDLGNLILESGDISAARVTYGQARAIFTKIGDKHGEATALTGLINLDWLQTGDLPLVKRELDQLLALDREVADKGGVAWALNGIGTVDWDQGELEKAMNLHEQALAISREIGKQDYEAWTLECIGNVLHSEGDLAGARKSYEAAIAIKRRVGNESGAARTLDALSGVDFDTGDWGGAHQASEEAMAIQLKLGETETHAESALSLANILIETGHADQSLSLLQSAATQFAKSKENGNEALAQGTLARALLALGKIGEAQEAAGRARAAMSGLQQNELIPARIDCARVDAAAGHQEQARGEIEAVLQKSMEIGWINYQFEARLALGGIDLKSSNAVRGRDELKALASAAESKGFGRFAQRARLLLSARG